MLNAFYSEASLIDNVQNKGHFFLLVKEDHQSIGFSAYEHDYKNKEITRLHKIYLLPDMQGKGIGK
jgi:GNAT superfamily N-acetyltransferase